MVAARVADAFPVGPPSRAPAPWGPGRQLEVDSFGALRRAAMLHVAVLGVLEAQERKALFWELMARSG